MGIHGGDVYRNHVNLDFSINVNPLGVPDAVQEALRGAAALCGRYPDIEAKQLKRAVSDMLAVSEEKLLFGNGASELLMAVAHAIRPRKTVIPVPSFYGYEHAAKAVGSEITYYEQRHVRKLVSWESVPSSTAAGQETFFDITEGLCDVLTDDVDMLFLANPNNPTGNLSHKESLKKLLAHCRKRGIYVVLDECFIEFCGSSFSMLSEVAAGEYDNLILVRAFTKIFSIPGVRLGYLLCSDGLLLERIRGQLPEWNLSCFAQEAGIACACQADFIAKTQAYVSSERQFLSEGLRRKGYLVFPSMANFILIYVRGDSLYERLLQRGILIRDCSNFRGLGSGFYRVAVRTRMENEMLLRACPQVGEGETTAEW